MLIHVNAIKAVSGHFHSGNPSIRAAEVERCRMISAPGRRTSQRLIEAEAYRRLMSGEAPQTLLEFSQQLQRWLHDSHPDAPPLTLDTIEARILDIWRARHELIRGG